MALTMNTHSLTVPAAAAFTQTQGSLSQSLTRLSLGLGVTHAAGCAAGSTATADNLHTQARSAGGQVGVAAMAQARSVIESTGNLLQ